MRGIQTQCWILQQACGILQQDEQAFDNTDRKGKERKNSDEWQAAGITWARWGAEGWEKGWGQVVLWEGNAGGLWG